MKDYILTTEDIIKLFSSSTAQLAVEISAKTEERNVLNSSIENLRLEEANLKTSISELKTKSDEEKTKAQEELSTIKTDIVTATKTLETTIASTVAISNDRNKASETVKAMLSDIEGIKKTIAPYFDSAKDILKQTELAGKEVIKLSEVLTTEVSDKLSTLAIRESIVSEREDNVSKSEERMGKLLIAVK